MRAAAEMRAGEAGDRRAAPAHAARQYAGAHPLVHERRGVCALESGGAGVTRRGGLERTRGVWCGGCRLVQTREKSQER